MISLCQNKRGFTFIELFLYVRIAGVMLCMLFVFLSHMLQARVKSAAIAEVEQQGLFVMHTLTQSIRNAEAVISPLPGGSAAVLSLVQRV